MIRVERRIEAEAVSFDEKRGDVERLLRERLTEEAMRNLYTKLFNEAKIEIVDPKLRELFYNSHPDHGAVER